LAGRELPAREPLGDDELQAGADDGGPEDGRAEQAADDAAGREVAAADAGRREQQAGAEQKPRALAGTRARFDHGRRDAGRPDRFARAAEQPGKPNRTTGTCAVRALELDLAGPPALGVALAHDLRVRHGAHDRANLDLPVPLYGRLLRAAAFLAPNERDLGADLDVRIADAERQHRALVVAVAREHRRTDDLVLVDDLVERRRRVVRQRQVDVL